MNPLIDSDSDGLELGKQQFIRSLTYPVVAVITIWVLHALRLMLDLDGADYGIIPRTYYGFWGIITAPLVHGNWGHLLSNTFPLFVLSTMTFYFYKKVAVRAFWAIYFLTGIMVWLTARPVSHIGASGVVYGLVAFIAVNGFVRGSVRSIVLALIVALYYGGMIWGLSPYQDGVSWESHMLGCLAGGMASIWFMAELEDEEIEPASPFANDPDSERKPFLPEGIFEKTKQQRAEEAAEALRLAQEAEEEQRRQQFPPYWFY
jgi:membrane associated rhomboid family serine protease